MKIFSEEDILKKLIKQAAQTKRLGENELHQIKKKYSREYKIDLPTNFKLQKTFEVMRKEGFEVPDSLQRLMRKRKVRTLSGVSVITVLTKPYPCPGKCVFCPTEPGMPKSYLSNEPGAMRAVLDNFHPRDQVKTRLDSLTRQGHETSKIEMIVLGGTFSAYNRQYQSNFIRALYNACNETQGTSLQKAQEINEKSKHRVIGLSLETRPDHITPDEIRHMRKLGCTKVQIGVQHTSNAVLDLNKRGEKIEDSIRTIRLLKDAGFKIATHLMPNLPGSSPEMDLQMVKDFFENPDFKPDHLKLYPCVVTPYSELEIWWKEGRFQAYSDEVLMDLLVKMKSSLPEYLRLERLFRDIPGETILEGSQKTNMRQLLQDKMKLTGATCRCIRCREIKGESYDPDATTLKILQYAASGGQEFFLSFDDTQRDKLCALLRLRFPSQHYTGEKHFTPELQNASIVREVHTYGAQVRVGKDSNSASQHAGLGRKLLEQAEKLSSDAGFQKIAVISGIGTRDYYRKWGYELEGTYMTKAL